MTPNRITIDTRGIAPDERHPLMAAAIRDLRAGESLQLIDDHGPSPLPALMEAQQPGQFEWVCLEDGPDVWEARITRLATARSSSPCCGCCGGA
jgi:uncharacterized protein (DUF2249 family)